MVLLDMVRGCDRGCVEELCGYFLLIFFLNVRTHEKTTTKTSREGTQMSCAGLTLGKINFWILQEYFYLPSNLFRMLQWNR
jgi:hypothetical protein